MRLRATSAAILVIALPSAADAQGADIAELCKRRSPCAVVEAKPAGRDTQGRALTVIELNLGKKNPENTSGDERFDCRPFRREFWLRVEGVAPAQRIFDFCNDGYGAAGVGDDEVETGNNRLVHARNGGSAWRWDVKRTIQLSPLRVLTEAHCSYHNIAPGFTTSVWDWQRFAGEARWTPKRCAPARTPAEEEEELGCTPEKATRRYLPIPMLEGALKRAGGKLLHLGSCAAAIDEGGQRGFVIHGTPRAGGAELRALMASKRDLIVTVTDDGFARGAASWVNDDHLELWLGHGRANLECENDKPADLRQFGIGFDGRVHAGYGNARKPPRVVARLERKLGTRSQVTLHLLLAEEVDGLTLVYSKSANGRQVRLVATSPIRRTDPTTLGGTWIVAPGGVACAERNGQLDLIDSGLPELLKE
jgi:hypothetical protein